jgi:hypothetical protein
MYADLHDLWTALFFRLLISPAIIGMLIGCTVGQIRGATGRRLLLYLALAVVGSYGALWLVNVCSELTIASIKGDVLLVALLGCCASLLLVHLAERLNFRRL